MKLFKLSQSANNDYDTYDSCVVAAESAAAAVFMHPSGSSDFTGHTWATTEHVTVEFIGDAASHIAEPQVICASFNAG